jgi:hypothetical protein
VARELTARSTPQICQSAEFSVRQAESWWPFSAVRLGASQSCTEFSGGLGETVANPDEPSSGCSALTGIGAQGQDARPQVPHTGST